MTLRFVNGKQFVNVNILYSFVLIKNFHAFPSCNRCFVSGVSLNVTILSHFMRLVSFDNYCGDSSIKSVVGNPNKARRPSMLWNIKQ